MKNLLVLLDESAPSFCYYEVLQTASRHPMTRATFEQVLGFADEHELGLQLVCGHDGAPPFVEELVGTRPYQRYLPSGSTNHIPTDVLIVNSAGWDLRALGSDRRSVCVLRLGRDELEQLPDTWERLSEHFYRVVLVLRDLDRYEQADLDRYETRLLDVRQRLATKYLRGEATELNALSDRMGLESPVECGAGIDHLTVVPSGDLYLCPGFSYGGEPPVGSISKGWSIPNANLLERSRAPICGSCDAFHCRRCVYMNRRATLEYNTPPWQVCRAAHLERKATRLMLASLHQRRCMEQIRAIAPLDYDDPLNPLMQVRHGIPRGISAVPRRGPHPSDAASHSAQPASRTTDAGPATDRRVGRVTPEERDEIQDLYRRRVGLSALLSTLARMDELQATPLYERVVRDMGATTLAYQEWWNRAAARYRWRRERPDQTWHIDFATCEVRLD
jgi:CXXX repeat modification system protein